MQYDNELVRNLVNHYREISLLGKVGGLLGWDLEVNLPVKAAETRAAQSAYVTKLISDKWLDSGFRNNLEKAANAKELTVEEAAIIRNLSHAAKFYHRVPQSIIVEFSETTSKAFFSWREAREKNNFNIFAADLKKVISLNQIIAEHVGYKENPYDALLDMYEPGFTAKEGQKIFNDLVNEITKLLAKIKKSAVYLNRLEDLGIGEYSTDAQKQIANYVLQKMGYDFKAGRMDVSAHPFTIGLGAGDTRITNRYGAHNFIESIMVALHEGGHALYDQGIDGKYDNTPLEGGVSLGIHESQSRFWENQVGRSAEFVRYLEPVLKAFYPTQLEKFNYHDLYKEFNRVNPSFIRVEADEVTYNLHIALRFELENALINNQLKVIDLPEVWREKMKKYLGVIPTKDSEGVLQDVHWSHGSFGYFPTYTLGNLYAAQFTYFMNKELEVKKLVAEGNFGTILSWLRENIHSHGSLYWPHELVKKVTRKQLSASYFSDYLNTKYKNLYEV